MDESYQRILKKLDDYFDEVHKLQKQVETRGEVVRVREVKTVHGEGFVWLFIGMDMPKFMVVPGEKLRIIKEG